MEDNFIGRCARCFKRHRGKCVALGMAAVIAATPFVQSMKDGQPHGQARPMVVMNTATTSNASVTDAFSMVVPNTMYPGPGYSGVSPALWQFVKRTPGAERPVAPSSGQNIVQAVVVKPTKST